MILGYLISYIFQFTIPENLKGWLMISIAGPLITCLFSASTWFSGLKHSFVHSQTWNQDEHGYEIIEWLIIYMVKHSVWSHQTFNNVVSNNKSIWWNDDDWNSRPQICQIPGGWILFKYKGHYLVANYPRPTATTFDRRVRISRQMTINSFQPIDWKEFAEDVRDNYYSYWSDNQMRYYRIDGDSVYYRRQITPIREGASIESCFGNLAKEQTWNTVLDFLRPEKKKHFKSLGQPYKTSFLIYGPPGTGKTEFIFQLASYTWKEYFKPIYIINPRGMTDSDLEEAIDTVTNGYILVNEWDLVLAHNSKKKDDEEDEDNNEPSLPKGVTYPSLKGWLDVLDQAQGEIIFWFTTNNYERLAKINDGALIRDGRIDHKIEFTPMGPQEVRNALKRFGGDQVHLIEKISDSDLTGLTIARVINHLKCELPLDKLVSTKSDLNFS